jgi:hypothetical protein
MKRSLFIIIGVILVLVLILVWVYVLFFSAPSDQNEQYGDLGFGDTTDTTYEDPVIDNSPTANVDIASEQRLRQLTTRPVAGFAEVQASSTSPVEVRYMEVGTGHIYSINLETGLEERISATTIPSAQKAEFSGDGQFVMIESGFGSGKEFIIGEINRELGSLTNTQIAEPVTSFSGTDDNRFLYSIQTNSSVIGKIFNPAELTNQTIFTLPFREASIEWGSATSDPHYVYPKTTRQLESFLYRIKNGAVSRTSIDGYGMSAIGNDDYVLFSRQEGETYQTYFSNTNSGANMIAPLTQIPEKCVMSEEEYPVVVCANTQLSFTNLLPDSWYKGEVDSIDNLWEYNVVDGSANLLINVEQSSGRQLDIINIAMNDDASNVYFTNRQDRTLWLFERIVSGTNDN